MEKKKQVNSKTKDVKKIDINMKNKDKLTEIKTFYNEKMKKAHIITSIILAVLYTIVFFIQIYSVKTGAVAVNPGAYGAGFTSQVKESFLLTFVIIIAGITPYIPLSVFGVAQPFLMIQDMMVRSSLGASFTITLYLGGLLQVIGIALSVVVGVYYCKLTTKKNKYYHHSDFGIDDVKMQLYEIRKDKKKVDEIVKKKEERAKEIEACNIKIPYLMFIAMGLAAFVLEFIGIVITKI